MGADLDNLVYVSMREPCTPALRCFAGQALPPKCKSLRPEKISQNEQIE
jgi:hypothetical protein